MTPEQIHLLINHFPLHGLLISAIVLWIGLLLKRDAITICGLAVTLLCCLSIPFVMGSGEAAFERFQNEAHLQSILTDEDLAAAKQHYDQAETGAKASYLLIVLSSAALISFFYQRKSLWKKLAWASAILCLAGLALNAWIAHSGGAIRRPDFRSDDRVTLKVETPAP
jgi:hypothetical protein